MILQSLDYSVSHLFKRKKNNLAKPFSNTALFLMSCDMLVLPPLGPAGMYSNLIQKYQRTNIFPHKQIWIVNTQQG